MDGTLLDSMSIWQDVGARYVRSRNVEPEENLAEILFPMTVEEGAIYVKQQYSLEESVEQIVQGVLDTVRDFYYYEAPLKAGTKEFLEALAAEEIPMVVATSSERDQIEQAFRRLNILQYFQKIFTCTEVGAGKRQPFIYQQAGKFLEAAPEEIFVFEDVLHAIKTAKEAGFRTVGLYDRSSEDHQEEIRETADIYLGDLTDFQRFWKYAAKGK